MNSALSMASTVARAAGRVSPALGASIALPLFAHVSRPRPVGADARYTMSTAVRSTVRIPGLALSGADVVVYDWGRGDDVVVLAHGWDGRASQFAALVRELLAAGFRVVAFDAPAHGDSPARGSYLIDWIDVFAALQQRYGRFRGIVGHSFGGLGALLSASGGLAVGRVVTVAAPADADLLLTQFQSILGHDDRTAAALRRRFATRYFPGEADPFARLSAVRRPLPEDMPLLAVHDEGDRVVPFAELARIAAANSGARTIATRGLGHNRVLVSDEFLDAVPAFLAEPTWVAGLTHPAEASA